MQWIVLVESVQLTSLEGKLHCPNLEIADLLVNAHSGR